MEKYCFIQIDADDNQWIIPRQRNRPYDIFRYDIFSKAIENIHKCLPSYPVTLFLTGFDMRVEEKVNKVKELLHSHLDIEIANHSLSHFNNFNCLSREEKTKEIIDSDRIIKESLGVKYIYGYRSPGYVFSNDIVEILKENSYTYDSSLFPSYFGPILRSLNYAINRIPGRDNFGHFINGFLPNEPVVLDRRKNFFEINVSVCPMLRVPIHYSVITNISFYHMMKNFIQRLRYLNFIFHLYDFVDVDIKKLHYVLNLITSQRKVVLSKDIQRVYQGK